MYSNINFLVLIFTLMLGLLNGQENYCSSPWEKVNNNICLLLNSNIKSWEHARLSCNFYNGDLLYINNEDEKNEIDSFLNTLLRYRFNLKPFAWLGATNKVKNDKWLWSHNNQAVNYSNWLNPSLQDEPNLTSSNCACFRLKDKLWRPCDCSTKQHYICRKTDPKLKRKFNRNEFTTTSTRIVSTTVTTATTTTPTSSSKLMITNHMFVEKDLNNVLDQEEKSIIVSSLVLMSDSENSKTNLQSENKAELLVKNDAEILENIKRSSGFLRDSTMFVNIYRTKILKNSVLFSVYECPYGFGYYSANNDCSKYKICENWDNKYAIISLNKCVDGKVFNFKDFQCYDSSQFACDSTHNAFIRVD